MLKGYGKESSGCHKMIKWCVIGLLTFLAFAVFQCLFIFIYYLAVHPILCKLYIPVDYYENIELYSSEAYLQYEDGMAFKEFLSSLEFLDNGEVVYFYYGDNHAHDNPIYGKACDIYAVDIQLDMQNYKEAKEKLISKDYRLYQRDLEESFVFLLPNTVGGQPNEIAFALNDTEYIIRCIMITEAEDFTVVSIMGCLGARSVLSFE